MSNRMMIKRDAAQIVHADTPALIGDEIQRNVLFQRRLTDEAIQRRTEIKEVLFPSDLSKVVRTAEREIVTGYLQTEQEKARNLNQAGLTLLQTRLEQIVRCDVAGSEAHTFSSLLARRATLEEELTSSWQRFCESAVEQQAWAESMPPAIRKATEKKIEDSLNGFFTMMDTMLREFEALVHQMVGRH